VAGLAAIGAGIGWIAVDGRTNCNPPPGGWCEQVYDTGTRGWIALGAGVVAAGVGTTLFLWKGKDAGAAIAVAPRGVAISAQF
jgi:hypothetical protein